MRALIQRVSRASVTVDGRVTGQIEHGLLVLLGITHTDTPSDAEWLARKITSLRIFPDAEDKMNLDLLQSDGRLLVVSQFTLHAQYKKGNRPSFIQAARPDAAIPLYEHFLQTTEALIGHKTETGIFGAMMEVSLINDGPVTLMLDSKNPE